MDAISPSCNWEDIRHKFRWMLQTPVIVGLSMQSMRRQPRWHFRLNAIHIDCDLKVFFQTQSTGTHTPFPSRPLLSIASQSILSNQAFRNREQLSWPPKILSWIILEWIILAINKQNKHQRFYLFIFFAKKKSVAFIQSKAPTPT